MQRKYRIGDRAVHATITKPRESLQTLRPAKHLVHVDHRYLVDAGGILYEGGKPRFILAHHHYNHLTRVFAALELNTQVTIQATRTVNSSLSRMSSGRESYGPAKKLWVCEDVVTSAEVVGLSSPEVFYYTNYPVTTEHLINDQRVRNVVKVSGVYRVEVHG